MTGWVALKVNLRLQRTISFLFLLPIYFIFSFYILFVRRYSIKNKHKIRQEFRRHLKKNKDPVLICANHLSFFDAFGILWGLGSVWDYLIHFQCFPWNVPSVKVAYATRFSRLISYLGKMIPIQTEGDRANAKQVLENLTHVLKRGDFAMLFPEGTRSTTGRLNMEDYGYGTGQILQAAPHAKVLLVYFRAEEEKMDRNLPKKGCQFYMKLKWLTPQTDQQGRQAVRALSMQVMNELWQMEQDYFEREAPQEIRTKNQKCASQ